MKIYISADIEGVTTTTSWADCSPKESAYSAHADQMTKEVLAACEGATAAGADEIVIKDAHGPADNIDITRLPENASIIRGWTGHPYMMVEGLDGSFDAALFVGYHSAAGRCGNPLSHTVSGKPLYIKINGVYTSEFMLYSWAAALEGVPTVFLSGDKMLCGDYAALHPKLITVAVKDGMGAMTRNLAPARTLKMIKDGAERALKQDLRGALCGLPDSFDVEVCYKEHKYAEQMSYYPGVRKVSDNTVRFQTDQYLEVLRTYMFIS